MDVALSNAPGSVTQQGGDRQFGKSEVASDAAERMAQRVRGNSVDLRGGAEPGEAALGGRVVAVADIGREDIRAILTGRLGCRELGRRRPDRAHLSIAFGVREMDIAILGTQPSALQALGLRYPKSCQEHKAHDCQGDGTFTALFSRSHSFTKPLDLSDAQASLLLLASQFADPHRGVGLDHI